MRARRVLRQVILPAIILSALCTPAFAADATSQPTDILKSDGLTKVGNLYLLDTDVKLPESLRNERKAEAQFNAYAKKRQNIQDQIDRANAQADQWAQQQASLSEQMEHADKSDPHAYNYLVNQSNERVEAIKQAQQFIDKCQKQLSQLQQPTDPAPLMMDLLKSMEDANQQYDALSKDPDVKAALDKLNAAPGIKTHLGPSAQFKSELPQLRRQCEKLNTAPIPLEIGGGVPHVTASLNGSVTVAMVVDSGAALVTLTPDIANQLGLKPGPNDPEVELVTADGTKVKGRIMKLSRIDVAQFSATDVECAILPPSVSNAECLLGGTFLKKFLYRMDLGTQQLFLTPLDAAQKATTQKLVTTPSGH